MSEIVDHGKNLNKFQRFFYNYGIYHFDFINVAIHMCCIPMITISLIRMLDYAAGNSPIPYGLVFLGFVSLLYFYVDPISGLLTSCFYLLIELNFLGKDFDILGYSHLNFWLTLHIISWIAQFIGHGIFEKRKPALMDNIFLTLNAPIFVTLEILERLNYRKAELAEARRCMALEVARYRASWNLEKPTAKDD